MKNNIKILTILSFISLVTIPSLTACSKNNGEASVQNSSTNQPVSAAALKKIPDGPAEKFDGTSRDAFDSSMEIIAKQLTDKQKETIDHAFQLLGDEFTDELSLRSETASYNLTDEVLKKVNGKTYGEVVLAAENYLQRNIDFKRVEINQEMDELLQKKEHTELEDKEQRKLAYLNEQREVWRNMKGTIAEFNFDLSEALISANLAGRTQGAKHKVTGYLPYETEPDKYRALYQTLYPNK